MGLVTRLFIAVVVTLAVLPAGTASARPWVREAQRDLNRLGCQAGPADGRVGDRTRAALVRFQSANRIAQSGRFTETTRQRLRSNRAADCAHRPVPRHSGQSRRIVLSQRQNWLWLVRANGSVAAQGGIVDNPGVLDRGMTWTGSKCGRAGRIKYNSDYGGSLTLYNFVRFAPCGIGFHQVPTYKGTRQQIHPDWLLGTDYRQSHGCVRVSRATSERLWDFTVRPTRVFVVGG